MVHVPLCIPVVLEETEVPNTGGGWEGEGRHNDRKKVKGEEERYQGDKQEQMYEEIREIKARNDHRKRRELEYKL